MRVLVDTSVWSRALRKTAKPDASTRRLADLVIKADVVLTGLILQEVLQGFRAEATFRTVARHLSAFPLLQLDRSHYVTAARLHRQCAEAGIAAATSDCQIAAAAIEHRCRLLTTDHDFALIAKHSALRLLPL